MMENIIEDDKEKNNHFLYLKRNFNKYTNQIEYKLFFNHFG